MEGATGLAYWIRTEKSVRGLSQYGHTEIIYMSRYILVQKMKLQIRTKGVYNMLAEWGCHITFQHSNR